MCWRTGLSQIAMEITTLAMMHKVSQSDLCLFVCLLVCLLGSVY